MHRREIAVLRTQLRDVNIEYSALVRSQGNPAKSARMNELRERRLALMALICDETRRIPLRMMPVQGPVETVERAA